MTDTSRDRFAGALLGLALGDALGAPFEGGVLERLLWRLIGMSRGKRRWTDDTQMSLDLAESLIAKSRVEPDDIAQRFAQSYRWSRGYGPGAARVLAQIRRGEPWQAANRAVYPQGSLGNGGAMRAPVIGAFFHHDLNALAECTRATARITHAHELGQAGAVLIALTTALALSKRSPSEITAHLTTCRWPEPLAAKLDLATRWLGTGYYASLHEVRRSLGNGMTALDSCVTAVFIGIRHFDSDFSELLTFAAALGGDVDTIGAMAGAIWGAHRGRSALPPAALQSLDRLEYLEDTANRLHIAYIASTRRSQ